MQTYLRDQVDWPQAFPAEEYAERRAKVCRALADAGLDAIYITAPANITWLTGYDMIDYHLEILTGVLLRVDSGTPLSSRPRPRSPRSSGSTAREPRAGWTGRFG